MIFKKINLEFIILFILIPSCSIFTVSKYTTDTYRNFKHLQKNELEGKDFVIETQFTDSPISIIAPHSGGIEPGTEEITKEIASDKYNYYIFAGIKKENNQRLHISSTNFDEPNGLKLVKKSKYVIVIHGCQGETDFIYLGGLDDILNAKIKKELSKAGFNIIEENNNYLSGKDPKNICNRNYRKQGAQLEISESLRKKMFLNLTYTGRKHYTNSFDKFIRALKNSLKNLK